MPRACAYHCGPTVMLATQIICKTPSIVYDLSVVQCCRCAFIILKYLTDEQKHYLLN
jgi:hypothetical protein